MVRQHLRAVTTGALLAALAVLIAACGQDVVVSPPDPATDAVVDVPLGEVDGTADTAGTDAMLPADVTADAAPDTDAPDPQDVPDDAATDADTTLPVDSDTGADAGSDVAPEDAIVPCEPADCADGNPCTADECLTSGCAHLPQEATCDDGDACTMGDACSEGTCKGGGGLCDDDNGCTADSCAQGVCTHTPIDGACTDGNGCTENDTCKAGVCEGTPSCTCAKDADCDDQNPCTTETCQNLVCIVTKLPVGAACDDGNACTFGDACSGGQCKAGPPPACNDGKQNGNETDIDCGGAGTCSLPACGTCGSNATCKGNGDCASLSCKLGHCQAPSCVDGLKNGDEEGVDCGGSCNMCPSLFLLAGGANSFGARLMKGGTWEKSDLGVPTVDGVGLALLSAGGSGTVVGAIRYTKLQDPLDNTLQVTMYADHVWSQPKILAAGITTLSAPELVALTGKVQIAFHGLDHWYYFSEFNGNVWSPVETVGSPVHYGPVGPALASKSGVTTLAFLDGASSNDLKVIDRSASWGAAKYVGNGLNFGLSPTAVVPTSGPDLMLAAVKPDQQIVYSQRTSGTWTSAALSSAWTTHRVAMAADNGQVALAFRGQDSKVYVTVWASVSGQWTVPATVGSTPATTKTTPAIAKGIGSGWELAWVATDGTVFHSSQVGGVWSQPVAVGVNANSVTLTR